MKDNKKQELIALSIIVSTVFSGSLAKKKINQYINNLTLNQEGIKIEDCYFPKITNVVSESDYFKKLYYVNKYKEGDFVYTRFNEQTQKYKIIEIENHYYESLSLTLTEDEVPDFKLFMKLNNNKYLNIVPIEAKIISVQSKNNLKIKKYTIYQEYIPNDTLVYKKINQ